MDGVRVASRPALQLPHRVEVLLAVYLPGPMPGPDDMEDALDVWLDTYADAPWPELVRALVASGGVTCSPVAPEAAPPPNEGSGRDAAEVQRLRDAHTVLLVSGDDGLQAPRVGLQAVSACARAWAAAFDGVIVDPLLGGPTAGSPHGRLLPGIRMPPVADHLLFHVRRSGRDAEVSTCGMARFGLPEVVLGRIPELCTDAALRVVEAATQALVELVGEASAGGSIFAIPDLWVSPAHLGRARGRLDVRDARSFPVRLDASPLGGDEAILRLRPPALEALDGWVLRVAAALPTYTELMGDDARVRADAAWRAHLRAVNEFPQVRDRTLAGLPRGTRLYVKRAFTDAQGTREYLWVAVSSCAQLVDGTLANEPRRLAGLSLGQRVTFPLYEVYDWLLRHPDGREEGSYTARVSRA